MSFAIKWGDESPENAGFIYFDAVTNWNQHYSGEVTSHPIDGGGNISDHFIRHNPKFTLSGVISSIDLSTNSWLISDSTGTENPYNVKQAPSSVSVLSTDNSVLNKFIPSSIGQFIPDTTPVVLLDPQFIGQEVIDSIKDALIRLVYSGKKYNDKTGQFDSVINTVTIYEYGGSSGTNITRAWPQYSTEKIVITDITFKEDVESGFGLYCDVSFEQVEFVSLKKVSVPKNVVSSLAKKSAQKEDTGKIDSTVKSTTDTNQSTQDLPVSKKVGDSFSKILTNVLE